MSTVETVKLSGHIVPDALVRNANAELVVTYVAYWAHGFYGIADGFVTGFTSQLSLQTRTGCFKSTCPISASTLRLLLRNKKASFRLMLRGSKTGNHIASNLEPEKQELRLQEHGLRIRSQYPDDLIFTAAEPFVKLTPIKGKVFRSDSGEPISNSYILLTSETDKAWHFDTRTDEKADIFLEAFRPEITRCLSMRGFQRGVKFPARIPSNKRRWTVATSQSNGNGRVRHSWKSLNSTAFPSSLTGRMSKTSIWSAGKDGKCMVNAKTGQ